jgi:hypothetical protein
MPKRIKIYTQLLINNTWHYIYLYPPLDIVTKANNWLGGNNCKFVSISTIKDK